MFIHRVKIQLKPNSFMELSQKIQDEIMPRLRLQKGFSRGATSIDTQWSTATEDTHWETQKDAEDYQLKGYVEILLILSGVIAANPIISIFEERSSVTTQRKKQNQFIG